MKISKGVYVKMIALGEGEIRPVETDFVKYVSAPIWKPADTAIGNTPVYVKLSDMQNRHLKQVLMYLHAGDSAHVICCKDADCETKNAFKIKLSGIFHTPAELMRNKEKESWKNDMEMKERERLAAYVQNNGIEKKKEKQGIYYIELKKGDGQRVKKGKRIAISYTGYFLNGVVFDSSAASNQPLEFTYGMPDQVIPGMELGLSFMRKGGKSKLIIPSQLAFGPKGSSTGIVPPFTTVIYEIQIIDVK